ncbi:4'-phosphopantetheinyl transferase family protein [Antarcticimicrobium sediminis]|uniref:Enterobactin synthase component D n=1 Tax=Antarcticimicrobium sediminis TaxID=2546227 RepID=A0A4V2Z784_9RHOB|nr:4'-phosphopantetheinyl transferase superfamily protein [Antarcticimicrobium sediminis]TDE35586.1 4'-phosphopantetheinyl transferase superfamily protein [Antarcticimicrobium sediminis]
MSAVATLCRESQAWTLARPLLPGTVALVATDPNAAQPPALPQERAALSGARPARLREFDAGRAAARRAMVQLGAPPAPVLHGADRAPIWPEGLVGTITHGAGACLAALAYRRDMQALGLDLEEAAPLEPDLFETICTGAELNHLAALPPDQRGLRAKLIFSAKEAAYKAQYPLSHTLFDFQTLEIDIDTDAPGQFSARFLRAIAPFAAESRLSGRYAIGGGRIVTAVGIAT